LTTKNDRLGILEDCLEHLRAESVELIDFDALHEQLRESLKNRESVSAITSELEELKEEYRRRILGMLKANLACRDNDEESDLAVRLTSGEECFSSGQLIGMYHRTACRFRNNFPSTFRYVAFNNHRRRDNRSWSDYKI